MLEDMFAVVPAHRRDDAHTALRTAFGQSSSPRSLRQLQGGSSGALIYAVEMRDACYLLRLETTRDRVRDPHRSYQCMRTAAEAGLAPALHHADPDTGVVVMDLISQQPLEAYPGGDAALTCAIARMIARLQTTPAFPPLIRFDELIARSLARVRSTDMLDASLLERLTEKFAHIREAYPWQTDPLVSSHNDLNPGNVLFDGQRPWLIDWELAFCNQPLVDLAMLADLFPCGAGGNEALLSALRGQLPDRALCARFCLMRHLTRLFRGCAVLCVHALGRSQPHQAPPALDLHALGMSYVDAFLSGIGAGDLEQSLEMARLT